MPIFSQHSTIPAVLAAQNGWVLLLCRAFYLGKAHQVVKIAKKGNNLGWTRPSSVLFALRECGEEGWTAPALIFLLSPISDKLRREADFMRFKIRISGLEL